MGLNRRRFLTASAAASAAGLAATSACAAEPGAATEVRAGADVLADRGFSDLRGRRIGVVTNPTGILRSLQHVVDAMHEAGSVDIAAVFGPEHGFRGTSQAGGSEGDHRDPRTGLPVYDAYGADAAQLAEMFRKAGVEQVVFDIADVGARFYTYIWTMYTAMQAAQRLGLGFAVLDRPNPIGGRVAGPRLDPAFASSVGRLPIVQQHGMTVGELARLFDREHLPERLPQLHVVRVDGWRGRTEATGLPWVPPSPNMPTADTAALYPGTGLFEGTVLSEGRGTTRPFEIIGAPGVDWKWAEELNAAGLDGVRFRETYFAPTFSKHAEKTCGGVQIHRDGPVDPIRVAVAMLVTARRLYPQVFAWRGDGMVDKLSGSARLREMIDAGADTTEIVESWHGDVVGFRRQRDPYLLYR
ncbi:exo-beta-N-acetylmuramidase NamZ domain-containing protein [Saccharopolyspora griseoalba]|uniref:Exo-beta-N-acetylmuramidase NamZ domain-containing protein n=1 Tax=Saccharopolyspora griseoalba TaxID=1431848 RepID=A0ABW2LHS5_9PSEU